MNKVYSLTTHKSWQSAMVDGSRLLLLNTGKTDEEAFMNSWNASGVKSWLRSKKEIDFSLVTELTHREEKAADLYIKHGSKKERLTFASAEDLQELAGIIAKAAGLRSEVRQMSKLKAAGSWIIGLLFTAGFTWVMHGFATGMLSPGSSGRRKGISILLYKLAQQMGPELVLAIAAALGAFLLYKIYQKLQQPPNEVVYTH